MGSFRENGDPNGPGLTRWPAFNDAHESYLEFGDKIVAKTALRKKYLDFMSDFATGLREHGVPATTAGSR